MMKDVTKYKFGSTQWQEAMFENIMEKTKKNEKLDDFEMAFIELQAEHNKRVKLKKVM